MKQFCDLTLLNLLFISLFLSVFIPLATPIASHLYAAYEQDSEHFLLQELSLSGPQHGLTQFPVQDRGDARVEHLSLDCQGEPNHDKSLVEKGWELYYGLNPIAQKAAPNTRGMGAMLHYGQQLLASAKRKIQKYATNQDEVAALKLGINIEWPGSSLHEKDRACYLQEALQSMSQIQKEFQNRQTTPLSNYVTERIADLKNFLAFTVDKSKPYELRHLILNAIQKTHDQSNLLDFDIPTLNMTGRALIPLYVNKLDQEARTVKQSGPVQAQADHDTDFSISSDSEGEGNTRAELPEEKKE